jgi:hypothetical protein
MANVILGIGSRVKHPEYGVVTNFKSDVYITFLEIGTKNIKIDYQLDVLDLLNLRMIW